MASEGRMRSAAVLAASLAAILCVHWWVSREGQIQSTGRPVNIGGMFLSATPVHVVRTLSSTDEVPNASSNASENTTTSGSFDMSGVEYKQPNASLNASENTSVIGTSNTTSTEGNESTKLDSQDPFADSSTTEAWPVECVCRKEPLFKCDGKFESLVQCDEHCRSRCHALGMLMEQCGNWRLEGWLNNMYKAPKYKVEGCHFGAYNYRNEITHDPG